MTQLILPSDSNSLGTAFGGRILEWMDICAAIAAQRHCRRQVVTASIDAVHFHAPVLSGEVAHVQATVNAAFRHSVEVAVTVHSEDPVRGDRTLCCSAYLSFTALDARRSPAAVPPLLLENDGDRARQRDAEARKAHRIEARATSQEDLQATHP